MRDIWRTVFAIAMVLMAVSIVSAENVYIDNNPARDVPPDVYGWLEVHIRGVTVQDANVLVARRDTAVNLSYLPDHTENVQEQNPSLFVIRVLTDGVSKPEMLATGLYTAYLRQGNADQPESIDFEIGNRDTTQITFLGAAYASGDEGCCFCHNVTAITPAYTIHHPEINHTVTHPPTLSTTVIVLTPAWDEEIFHPSTSKEIQVLPITHNEWRSPIHYQITGHKWFKTCKGGVWKVTCTNPGHSSDWHIESDGCMETVFSDWRIFPLNIPGEEMRVVVGVLGYTYVLPGKSAWTEIVHHPAQTNTITSGEAGWVEIVVDKPAWDEQVGEVSHEETVCGQRLVCPCGCVR